jgi:four helix bundle protein
LAIRNYRDLNAWQKVMDLVVLVYNLTKEFPDDERFGLTSQLRRAAVSIPSNIAEGQGRDSDRDFARFLSIAHGSLREVETQLLICDRLEYVDLKRITTALEHAADVGRLMTGLIKAIERASSIRTACCPLSAARFSVAEDLTEQPGAGHGEDDVAEPD